MPRSRYPGWNPSVFQLRKHRGLEDHPLWNLLPLFAFIKKCLAPLPLLTDSLCMFLAPRGYFCRERARLHQEPCREVVWIRHNFSPLSVDGLLKVECP